MKLTATDVRLSPPGTADPVEEVRLFAVYNDSDKAVNARWSKWTPAAQLQATISNPAAQGQLVAGRVYRVLIEEWDEQAHGR